ncbi:MAG: hypothetical protein K8H99_08185 [Nitrospirae bacterium]|nr:hypothetical protein [Fimbriimonadaceae bacterium]
MKNQLDVANREYDYDGAGRVSVFRNAGLRETMTYDAAGRQTGRRFNSGERVTQMYDALGRRTTLSDFWGVATTTYDALGRVTRESNRGLATQYEYDQNGNRTLMVDPSGGRFTYLYDELDRLKSMQVPTGQRYTQQYDADSRRTTLLLGLGSKRRYEYDSVGRITTQIELNSSNQRIYTMVDSYDAVGNRTGRNSNGNPTTWLYDDAYRLIGQEKSGQTATFVYDANSNLTTKQHQGGSPRTIAYDVADRITTYQEGSALTTLAWQSRGAMHTQKTGTDTTTFTYSDPMFLAAVDGPSGRLATYVYDSESKRRRIYEGAAFTTLVWDGWDYLQWRRPSGTHVFHTMNGEIVGKSVGGTVRDYLLDPLGSVVATLDSGGLVDQFEYWPYGELVDDLPEGAPVFLWVGGLGYWFDTDERRYVRHRMLRTDLGSWMQLDPLWPSEPAALYVGASPTAYVDPFGLRPSLGRRIADFLWTLLNPPSPILPRPTPPAPWDLPLGEPTPTPRFRTKPYDYPRIIPFDDQLFSYGSYCGRFTNCGGPPRDCIDVACKEHDRCTEGMGPLDYLTWQGYQCNWALCRAAKICGSGGCAFGLADPGGLASCQEASRLIGMAFCPMVLVL